MGKREREESEAQENAFFGGDDGGVDDDDDDIRIGHGFADLDEDERAIDAATLVLVQRKLLTLQQTLAQYRAEFDEEPPTLQQIQGMTELVDYQHRPKPNLLDQVPVDESGDEDGDKDEDNSTQSGNSTQQQQQAIDSTQRDVNDEEAKVSLAAAL